MTGPNPLPFQRPAAALFGAGLVLSLGLPAASAAQALGEDLGALRVQLAAFDEQVQLAQASGYDSGRLDTFEGVVRDLTGRVETMEFRLRQLSDRLERLETQVREGAAGATEPAPAPPSATYRPPQDEEPASQGQPRVLGSLPQTAAQTPGGQASEQASGGAPAAVPLPDQQPQPGSQPGSAGQSQQQAAMPAGDAAAQYDQAFGLLRQANWGEAESALRAFLERHPDHGLAGNAKYWLGETHYVRGDYVTAARVFAEAFQQYPNSGKAPDNLLKLGMSLAALDRRQDACGTFAELERRYADAPAQIIQRSQAERNRLGC